MSRETDAWRARAEERYAQGVEEGRRLEREDTLAWLRHLACVSRSMVTAFPPGALRAAYQILGTAYEAGALYVASGRHVGASEGGAAGSDSEAGGAPTGSAESRGGQPVPPTSPEAPEATVGDGRPGPEEAAFMGWLEGELYPERRKGGERG